MTPQEWDAFVKQHGGIKGQTALTRSQMDANGQVSQQPTGQVHYVFNDNTWLVVAAGSAPPGSGPDDIGVVNPGTAMKPQGGADKPITQKLNGVLYQWDPTSQQWNPAEGIQQGPQQPKPGAQPRIVKDDAGNIFSENADGSLTWQAPSGTNGGTTNVNAPPSAKFIVTKDASGNIRQQPNPNYDPDQALVTTAKIHQADSLATARAIQAQVDQGKLTIAQANQQLAALKEQDAKDQDQMLNNYRTEKNSIAASHNSDLAQYYQNQNQLTARGQDVNTIQELIRAAGNVADATVRGPLLPSLIQNIAPTGQLTGFVNGMNALSPTPIANPNNYGSRNLPFDPRTIGAQVTANALAGVSPAAAALIGAQSPAGSFTVGGASNGTAGTTATTAQTAQNTTQGAVAAQAPTFGTPQGVNPQQDVPPNRR